MGNTLLGGWMRFLLAWAGDKNRLFFEPVYSLKLGVWSGRLNGFVTSDKKFCFEKLQNETLVIITISVTLCDLSDNTYAICNLPMLPMGMLFKCCTHRSTATPSPICTIAVPSFVFKNFIWFEKKKLYFRNLRLDCSRENRHDTDSYLLVQHFHIGRPNWRVCQCLMCHCLIRKPS